MSRRNPVQDAFVYLAGKLSRAVRIKDRVAAQGGDLDEALAMSRRSSAKPPSVSVS